MSSAPNVGASSHLVDVDGPVHYADYGGPAGAPLLVGVHGLGGSHLNWAALAPHLIATYRLIAPDLLGHGRTPPAGRTPDIEGHRRMLDGFLRRVSDRPVVLVGNSMGGLVVALQAAEAPATVAGVVLVDPALPADRPGLVHPRVVANLVLCALPGVGEQYLTQRRRRTTPEQTVRRVLTTCCVDRERVPAAVVDAHVALTAEVDRALGDQAYLTSARSLSRALARPRSTTARLDTVDQPVLLLHGERDRLVPLAAARRMVGAHPGWRLQVARDIGHAPMLEAPVWTGLRIAEWLGGAARSAADRAADPVATPGPPLS